MASYEIHEASACLTVSVERQIQIRNLWIIEGHKQFVCTKH